ncbi:MAG: cell division protein FtsA, partial [Alphaproteobacteria bacterium]
AERLAETTVSSVLVSANAAPMTSETVEYELSLDGHPVSQDDLERLLSAAAAEADARTAPTGAGEDEAAGKAGNGRPPLRLLHAFPLFHVLDGVESPRPPVGLHGQKLGIALHVVRVADAPLRNLQTAIERAHLEISGFVVAPFAAGLSCLTPDERELGAAIIDIGAGRTALGIFAAGRFVFGDTLAIGGDHVTRDIAQGLLTPIEQAERLKTLSGSALVSPSDDRETIEIVQLGGGEREQMAEVPRSALTGIIAPRVEEILELAMMRLTDAGFVGPAARRIVLTGGLVQLPGLRECAERMFEGRSVRIGMPRGVLGLADATAGPAFSVAAGLLHYAAEPPGEVIHGMRASGRGMTGAGGSGWKKVGRWLKENF